MMELFLKEKKNNKTSFRAVSELQLRIQSVSVVLLWSAAIDLTWKSNILSELS